MTKKPNKAGGTKHHSKKVTSDAAKDLPKKSKPRLESEFAGSILSVKGKKKLKKN